MNTSFDWPRYLASVVPGARPEGLDGLPPAAFFPGGADTVLWAAATAAHDAAAAAHADALLGAATAGPLRPSAGFATLEVWTECELSALHALWRICRVAPSAVRVARLQALVAWHLEHTQPDNATNRPWAVHVFALHGTPEADLYAQTLVHNVSASDARHEALSAWVLHDAARELALHKQRL